MSTSTRIERIVIFLCLSGCLPLSAHAQIVEAVGSRALGMGGAFVAVATDSSATWWNPGALAAGPLVDTSIGRASEGMDGQIPARRGHVGWWAMTTPVFGLSYYRIHMAEAKTATTTGSLEPAREDSGAVVPLRSFTATQFGVTVVQSLLPGVHVGTTLKYVRGTVRAGTADPSDTVDAVLDNAEDLRGGDAQGRFDLDAGVIAVAGPLRFGGVIKNIRAPKFSAASGGAEIGLPRQARIGAAFDADAVGGWPLILALDADVHTYRAVTGDRRVVALGAEHWLMDHRLGLRAGGRFNTVGAGERSATAGVSVAVRPGMYLEAHVVGGGAADEKGWGAAARVSF